MKNNRTYTFKKQTSQNIIVPVILTLLTILFPIIACPVNFLCMILLEKHRKYYACLLAFSIAIFSYVWVPASNFDLYRHHLELQHLTDFNTTNYVDYLLKSFEFTHYSIKYLVAQTNNFNLLQFLIVFIGYYEIFWIVCDYSASKKASKLFFTLVLLYASTSIRFIDFASGLWFNFASINIALGAYLQFVKKKKIIPIILYLLAAGTHISTISILLMILLTSKTKLFSKIHVVPTILLVSLVLSIGLILPILGSNGGLFGILYKMYNSYFIARGDEAVVVGFRLYIALANIVFTLLVAIRSKGLLSKKYIATVYYLSILTSALILQATIFIRFVFPIILISIPLLIEYLIIKKKNKHNEYPYFLIVLTAFIIIRLYLSISQAYAAGLIECINTNLLNNIFVLESGAI